MTYTASALSLRNLHDVFGEIDPARRRAAIDEIFRDDAVFHEPNGTYSGRDEIDRIAGVNQGYSSRLPISVALSARGDRRRLSGPLGVGQPWQAAGLRRNRFRHRPGRQDRRRLSVL